MAHSTWRAVPQALVLGLLALAPGKARAYRCFTGDGKREIPCSGTSTPTGGVSSPGVPATPAAPSSEELARQAAYAANARGNEAFAKRDYATAAAHYREALRSTPDDPVIQQNLRNTEEWIAYVTAEAQLAAAHDAFWATTGRTMSASPGGSPDFDGTSGNGASSGLAFMGAAPPGASAPTQPSGPLFERGTQGSAPPDLAFLTDDAKVPASIAPPPGAPAGATEPLRDAVASGPVETAADDRAIELQLEDLLLIDAAAQVPAPQAPVPDSAGPLNDAVMQRHVESAVAADLKGDADGAIAGFDAAFDRWKVLLDRALLDASTRVEHADRPDLDRIQSAMLGAHARILDEAMRRVEAAREETLREIIDAHARLLAEAGEPPDADLDLAAARHPGLEEKVRASRAEALRSLARAMTAAMADARVAYDSAMRAAIRNP